MRPRRWRCLDEIYAGVFDGLTYHEIEQRFPAEFSMRAEDKLSYRYPRGESYLDVIQRLDPLIHELERQTDPVVIVGCVSAAYPMHTDNLPIRQITIFI